MLFRSLFEKGTKDWDFLWIRLGQGRIEPRICVELKKKEELTPKHSIWDEAEQMIENQNKIENAPVILDLQMAGKIGIIGTYEERILFLEMILFQTICSHSEEDVKIILIGDEKSIIEFFWMRFLPHIQKEEGRRWIGWDKRSRGVLAKEIQIGRAHV